MNTRFNCILFFSIVLVCSASPGNSQPVVCDPLSPPEHGSLNASDGNNLYSKATYACDPGYSLKGPTRRQCLPVPYPNSAVWMPDEVTSCVKDIIVEESDAEVLLVFDPTEDEIPDEEKVFEEFSSFPENVNDPEDVVFRSTEQSSNTESLSAPPSLVLSAQPVQKPQMFLQPNRDVDELCVRWEEIPKEYQCAGDQVLPTSSRWLVDEESGVCKQKDFCGPDDEIEINGLFHTLVECRRRCMS